MSKAERNKTETSDTMGCAIQFTIHDPIIRDPMMHDSCINYQNMFTLR